MKREKKIFFFILLFLVIFFILMNFTKFKPTYKEIKNIESGINEMNLNESINKDKKLLESHKIFNELGPEETIKNFIKAYNNSNIQAVKYIKPIPDFFRFDYYNTDVLNSYKKTNQEKVAIEATKSRIFKNYYIYNLVKDIDLNNYSIKLLTNEKKYKIYSVEVEYINLTKNIKDVSELLYKEEDTASFLKFLKENATRKKETINIYVENDPQLGYRIDLSNKENYNLISVLSGGLSDFTLK